MVPATDDSVSPSKVNASPTKRATGLRLTLKRRSPFSVAWNAGSPTLRVLVSIVMSALPVLAARSRTTAPSLASKWPRCVDIPMCVISNVTTVWPGSMAKVSGAAMARPEPAKRVDAIKVLSMERSL